MARLLRVMASVVVSVGFGVTQAEARENHAILIGASTYPNLDQRYWLKGPANDIDLVATYLTTSATVPFDPDNVAILADGILGKPAPTLAAIRQAFQTLEGKLEDGDFVYLHFSGHGSQAPAADPESELDGLDELFLPVDIGPWDDTTGTVENALVDDEIGMLIGGLQAKGATVWVVFDSCHSGTATRAAPAAQDDVRLRKLDPHALGLSSEALMAAEDDARSRSTTRGLPDPRKRPQSPVDTAGKGDLVAFFAAQTNETTPEKRMPKGHPDRRSQGVFTYVLFETLAQNPGITYRQLGQEILRRYSVLNLARSTPMFEGDLDNQVFSKDAPVAVAQWPVETVDGVISVNAGALHGISEGQEMLLLASATDPDSASLGRFKVTATDAFSSQFLPNEKASALDVPRGAYLRKVKTDMDFSLTVALPERSKDVRSDEALELALNQLVRSAQGNARLRFVASTEPADVRLAILPDSARATDVWLLPASGILQESGPSKTPSIGVADKTADELALVLEDSFQRMSRALNLLRIGAGFGAGTEGGAADGSLDVEVSLRTKNKRNKKLRTLDAVSVPRLVPGDEVHVLAQNNSDEPVDINVLYVGSDYSISHFFAGRLQPGDSLKKGLLRITEDAFGRDRVILVLSPAKPQSIVENLSFMEQDELPTTRGEGRGGLASAFAEAGFGATTRAAMALEDEDTGPMGQVFQFEIDTLPAGQ